MRYGYFVPLAMILFLGILGVGWNGQIAQAQETGTPTPVPVKPTPTIDRLAAPPTVENPTQADEGAYLYWLNCQPCHGDQGQGLTDEWRAQYPMEDQNCWMSGCHGERPYEDGFSIPRTIPAVIGGDSLRRFTTLGQLYAYIRVSMPYEYPGALPDEEYLAIAAFLARAHGLWDGATLTTTTVNDLPFYPTTSTVGPIAVTQTPFPATAVHSAAPPTTAMVLLGVLLGGGLLIGGLWVWQRHTDQ